MCAGGLDPKYGLGDLERQFKIVRQSIVVTDESCAEASGILGWAGQLIARGLRGPRLATEE